MRCSRAFFDSPPLTNWLTEPQVVHNEFNKTGYSRETLHNPIKEAHHRYYNKEAHHRYYFFYLSIQSFLSLSMSILFSMKLITMLMCIGNKYWVNNLLYYLLIMSLYLMCTMSTFDSYSSQVLFTCRIIRSIFLNFLFLQIILLLLLLCTYSL